MVVSFRLSKLLVIVKDAIPTLEHVAVFLCFTFAEFIIIIINYFFAVNVFLVKLTKE